MKLRWYQYSLRSLMLLVLLTAIFMSWLAVKMNQARQQRADIEELRILGMGVQYDWQVDSIVLLPKPGMPFIIHKRPEPNWLRKIFGDDFFDNVVVVDFNQAAAVEKNLLLLKKFPKLRYIGFPSTNITDVGLQNLGGTSIQSLNLTGSKITDAGLVHLKNIPNLQRLNIDNTAITDAGLEHLKNLTNLKDLNLQSTKITDKGLISLKSLSKLETLNLRDTQITYVGLQYLEGLDSLKALKLVKTDTSPGIVIELQKTLKSEIFHNDESR